MKTRISISLAIILFSLVTALGLATILIVNDYANRQLRIGGPLYSQIKLGNDLVADILPPPEYIVEAYLEATLALHDPSKALAHKQRLAQLHKEYDERRDYWIKSDLDPALKTKLTSKSDAAVQRFWSVTERELLPALIKKEGASAEKAYAQLASIYAEHRALIDEIVKQVNIDNSALEVSAADRVGRFSVIVWGVSGIVALVIALGLLGMVFGVIRPLVRITEAMKKMADGNLNIFIPGLNRGDEIGDIAKAIGTISNNAEAKAREESEAKVKQDLVAAQQRKREMHKLADDFEGAVGKIIETVSMASTGLES
ncbi:MAG TPA: HAMP domain-containing protein, partial [Candidatus Acidoferrum sp.]|nr:HAMP domain-containing protein [Candidatus Acidoferrum sp.]